MCIRDSVYTSAGYMLRIDCWKAEKNLKTTYGSESVSYTHLDVYKRQPEVRHRAQSDGIVFLWNITDIDVSYELPVSLIQIRASSQARCV